MVLIGGISLKIVCHDDGRSTETLQGFLKAHCGSGEIKHQFPLMRNRRKQITKKLIRYIEQ